MAARFTLILAVALYLAIFFLLLHLIDRLAARPAVEARGPAQGVAG